MFSHRAIPIVLAAVLIDTIGYGIVLPVLPTLITRLGHLGLADATRIGGWLLVSYSAAQFVSGPILGALGDRFGRRPVLIASMATFAVDYAVMAAAPSLWWLFLGRAIAGLTGSVTGPAGAVIADLTKPADRAAAFGLIGAAFGAGFILGPALGGLAGTLGPRVPFLVSSALAGANAIVMVFLLPETLPPEGRRPFRWRDATVLGSFRPLFTAGRATPLLAANFLWQVGGVVYPSVWAFWATLRFGWSGREIGFSLTWVGFMMAVVQVGLTKRVIARLGERRAAMLGLGCGAACLLAYAFTTHPWQVYAFFLVGSLTALAWPALNGLLSRLVDERHQGALQGGIGASNSVASILGPLLAAQSLAIGASHGFDGLAFVLAAALLAAALAIIATLVPASIVDHVDAL
ncbi:MFS transporter [uncultured Sphingomonas sp.]|uniref:MFS transporter n=1 Tax=uncultured Sphingomonas sp. TaxID=158754 RepID=UPI0035CA6D22